MKNEPRPEDGPHGGGQGTRPAPLETTSARRLAFLVEAGRILSSSLDCDTTLRSVARLAVPTMADYCLVDLVQSDGSIRRVATAHRDTGKEALTAELRCFPPDPHLSGGVPRVLRTGEATRVSVVDEDALRAATQGPEHLRVVRELGPRSYLIVPLIARNHVLGALTFTFSDSGRSYEPEDLTLAEELARHAALAIDNARLYQDARSEIEQREQAHRELERKKAFLQLMLEITTAANEAPSLEEALRIALLRVRAHTRWPVGHAYLAGRRGELVPTDLWSTDDPERFQLLRDVLKSASFVVEGGLPHRVLATGREAAVTDLATDPSFSRAPLVRDLGVQSAFAFPVLVGTEVVAVLEFFSGRSTEPDAAFLEVIAHVGTQLGRVAERERSSRALQESESRFRQLADNIREVFWIAEPDVSRLLYVSPAFEHVWGRSVDDVYGDPRVWADTIHPDDRPRVQALLEAVEEEREIEYRIVRPNGEIRWIYARGVPVRDEEGAVFRLVGIAEDITDEKRAGDDLRESREQWHLLFDSSPLPRWVFEDETLRLLDVNAAAVQHYGYTREELHSMTLRDLQVEKDAPRLEEALSVGRDGAGYLGVFRHQKKSGEVIDVELTTQPVKFRGRSAQLAVIVDVTERRRIEAERVRLLARERDARAQAEDAVRVRDEVLRMVSHDLRNPVHTIKLAASLITEVPLPEEERAKQLQVIRRTADHMQRLVQGLLDLKRIEAGHAIPVEPRAHEVAALLANGHSLFRPQADAKGVRVVNRAPEGLPMVQADAERILQVLWNLTGNAIKFTPSGGSVIMNARARDTDVLFSVTDSGPGIPLDEKDKLFDPFWQAKRTARLGTGLGLPISKAIVEAHGGHIWVESTLGEGTTFFFTLPCTAPTEEAGPKGHEAHEPR